MSRKLGRLPKRPDARRDRMALYMNAPALPNPPAGPVDWRHGVSDWGMMLNDTLGDCGVASLGHMVMVWTANVAGTPAVVPDATVRRFYLDISPDDQGVNMEDALRKFASEGLGGHRAYGWAPIDPNNDLMVKTATWLFGPLYFGVTLADGDNDPSRSAWSTPCYGNIGGHAIPSAAHSDASDTVISWGGEIAMTAPYRKQRCDELYAALSPDWFHPETGKSPAGFTLAESGSFLVALGGSHGTLPPPPNPPPGPAPRPVPPAQAPDPFDFGGLF